MPTVDNLVVLSAVFNVAMDDIVVKTSAYIQCGKKE